jgi:hypothetical protein
MPKFEEVYHFYKKMERSDTVTLGILAHFSHFRHFCFLLFLKRFKLCYEYRVPSTLQAFHEH